MKNISIFALIVPFIATQALAQTFKEVDFERLLMKHPIMQNYDAKTGHFKNTPYELKSVEGLRAENASMTAEIQKIESLKNEKSLAAIKEDIEDEESFWESASKLNDAKNRLKMKIAENEELILSGGKPAFEKLFPITEAMTNDLIINLYDKDKLVLNKLPRYYNFKPDFNGKDFQAFWHSRDPLVLEAYLSKASSLSLIFPNSDKAILYQKVEETE